MIRASTAAGISPAITPITEKPRKTWLFAVRSGRGPWFLMSHCWDLRRIGVCYAVCVKRTTIMLPDELDVRLRLEAKRRSLSIADIAREAIDEHVPPARPEGGLSFFAIGEGSSTDASERVDEIVGDAMARRHDDSAA